MQYQNSKKGRQRKVIREGKADVSFTGKGVTSHGGMALVSWAMYGFGLRRDLKSFADEFLPEFFHRTDHLLEQIITLRLMGGEAMIGTRMLGEPALCALFDWSQLAHPTTFGRRLQGFSYRPYLVLQQMVGSLNRLTQKSGPRLITIDSTVSTANGQSMEGARIGYTPHKPGRPSYHPILAVDVGARSLVDGYLRPGDTASGNGLKGFIGKIVSEAKGKPSDLTFRLDNWFNNRRLLEPIGNIPPVEFEQMYYQNQESKAMVA